MKRYKRLEDVLIKGKKTRKPRFFCAKCVVFFQPSSHILLRFDFISLFKSSTRICYIDINLQVNTGVINQFSSF